MKNNCKTFILYYKDEYVTSIDISKDLYEKIKRNNIKRIRISSRYKNYDFINHENYSLKSLDKITLNVHFYLSYIGHQRIYISTGPDDLFRFCSEKVNKKIFLDSIKYVLKDWK